MNAVKNCLVVLAAAVALASCSADPTSSSAGKNLVLTVTPQSLNIHIGDTVEVFASAQDPLGGAAFGNFSITGGNGAAFTATIDSTYTPVYAGTRPQGRTRVVVVGLQTTNGSFTISGTGGQAIVQVRVAPDSASFGATVSSLNPTVGSTDTVTAPAGIRFTHSATVTMSGTNGLAAPSIAGYSSDSSAVYVLPAPGAAGRFIFNGLANVATPTLKYGGETVDSVTVASVTSFPATFTTAAPALNVLDTITAGAGWKFTPASTAAGQGLLAIVIGMSADSSKLFILPPPVASASAAAALTVSGLKFAPYANLSFTLPTSSTTTPPVIADAGNDDPTAGPVPGLSLPALGNVGIWDIGSFTVQDHSDDAGGPGINSQVYQLTLGVAAPTGLTATVTYPAASADIDVVILQGSGSTNLPDIASGGTSAAHPEVATTGPVSAGTYLVDLVDYGPAFGAGKNAVGKIFSVLVNAQ